MYWNNWPEFWNMGGYAFYVWGSFGVTALALFAECWSVRRGHQQALLTHEAESLNSESQT
jgi:heme exporter protein D